MHKRKMKGTPPPSAYQPKPANKINKNKQLVGKDPKKGKAESEKVKRKKVKLKLKAPRPDALVIRVDSEIWYAEKKVKTEVKLTLLGEMCRALGCQ